MWAVVIYILLNRMNNTSGKAKMQKNCIQSVFCNLFVQWPRRLGSTCCYFRVSHPNCWNQPVLSTSLAAKPRLAALQAAEQARRESTYEPIQVRQANGLGETETADDKDGLISFQEVSRCGKPDDSPHFSKFWCPNIVSLIVRSHNISQQLVIISINYLSNPIISIQNSYPIRFLHILSYIYIFDHILSHFIIPCIILYCTYQFIYHCSIVPYDFSLYLTYLIIINTVSYLISQLIITDKNSHHNCRHHLSSSLLLCRTPWSRHPSSQPLGFFFRSSSGWSSWCLNGAQPPFSSRF